MADPKISVIMSVYNGERYLREAIERVLNQTFADFEFIIVNDASTDSSLSIIRGYHDDRIRIIENSENIGLTKSLNKAIKQARGEYIARQDADDISLPTRFQEQVSYLERHPDVAVLGTSVYRIDERGKVVGKMILRADASKKLFKRNQFSHGSIMVRKAVLDRLGGYNELFRYGQDYELWLRIARHNQVRNLKKILYKLRFHRESIGTTRREESLLCHLLAIRLATGTADEAMLETIREKGLSSLHSYLNKSEQAYLHKELAGMYMTIDDIAAAREHYKQAFKLKPLDIYNDFNLMISYAGRNTWSKVHRIYEYFRYELF